MVPRAVYTLEELVELVETTESAYADAGTPLEGVYLKVDEDDNNNNTTTHTNNDNNNNQNGTNDANSNNDDDGDGIGVDFQPTFNLSRAKLVRKEFIQAITTHWSKHDMVKNTIAWN